MLKFIEKTILLLASYWLALKLLFPLMVVASVIVVALVKSEVGIIDFLLIVVGCFVATLVSVATGIFRVTEIGPGDPSKGFEIE